MKLVLTLEMRRGCSGCLRASGLAKNRYPAIETAKLLVIPVDFHNPNVKILIATIHFIDLSYPLWLESTSGRLSFGKPFGFESRFIEVSAYRSAKSHIQLKKETQPTNALAWTCKTQKTCANRCHRDNCWAGLFSFCRTCQIVSVTSFRHGPTPTWDR